MPTFTLTMMTATTMTLRPLLSHCDGKMSNCDVCRCAGATRPPIEETHLPPICTKASPRRAAVIGSSAGRRQTARATQQLTLLVLSQAPAQARAQARPPALARQAARPTVPTAHAKAPPQVKAPARLHLLAPRPPQQATSAAHPRATGPPKPGAAAPPPLAPPPARSR